MATKHYLTQAAAQQCQAAAAFDPRPRPVMLLARFEGPCWLIIGLVNSGDDEMRLDTRGVLCGGARASATGFGSDGALIGRGALLEPGKS